VKLFSRRGRRVGGVLRHMSKRWPSMARQRQRLGTNDDRTARVSTCRQRSARPRDPGAVRATAEVSSYGRAAANATVELKPVPSV